MKTKRTETHFGALKVDDCVLTAESVDNYLGSELPNFQGKDISKVYRVYRPLKEIRKALDSYNDVPVVDDHHFVIADESNRDKWLGTTGTNAKIADGKLYNNVTLWDSRGTFLVKEVKQNLSCGYKYLLVTQSGTFKGMPYDLIMKDIQCNHVALVIKGRVDEAQLADNQTVEDTKMDAKSLLRSLTDIFKKSGMLDDESRKERADVDKYEYEEGKEDEKNEDESRKERADVDKYEYEEGKEDERKKKKKKKIEVADESREERADVDKYEYEEGKEAAKDMAKDEIMSIAMDMMLEVNSTKELCENIIGKSFFAADSTPESMIDATLIAKGYDIKGKSSKAKRAVIEYMSSESINAKKVLATDSHVVSKDDSDGDFLPNF